MFIKNAECPKPIENLQGFIQNYQAAIPKINGLKANALSGVLRDLPENEFSRFTQHSVDENTAFNGVPEIGVITSRDLDIDELAPHFFVPNFVRPLPEAEDDPDLDAPDGVLEHDISDDAKRLIRALMEPDLERRMTVADAIEDEWCASVAAKLNLPKTVENIKSHVLARKFKGTGLAVIAQNRMYKMVESKADV